MKKELQDKLFKKYPKIFRRRTFLIGRFYMRWGIECGDGWYNLINKLCKKIQEYCNKDNTFQAKAIRVKEQFRGLRFYIDGGDDYIYDLINNAENESYKICEDCGAPINITVNRAGRILSLIHI